MGCHLKAEGIDINRSQWTIGTSASGMIDNQK
jgi:hypothetical protein